MTLYYMTAGGVTYPRTAPGTLPKIIITANPLAPHNLGTLTVYRDTSFHGTVTGSPPATSIVYLSAAQYDKLAADLANPGIVQISFDSDGASVSNWNETWQPQTVSAPAVIALLQQIQASAQDTLPTETADLIQTWLDVLPPGLPIPDPSEEQQTNAYVAQSTEPVRIMLEVSVKHVPAISTAGTNGRRPVSMAPSTSVPMYKV